MIRRPIIGFHLDTTGHWTALLSCGHVQHVRHDPPLVDRPWVLSAEGRSERLGQPLDCVRCERMELPSHYVPHRRTREWTAESMPPALRDDHATGAGTWARIVVREGTLRYRATRLGVDALVRPERDGVIVPEVGHSVEPSSDARFFLVFYGAPVETEPIPHDTL